MGNRIDRKDGLPLTPWRSTWKFGSSVETVGELWLG